MSSTSPTIDHACQHKPKDYKRGLKPVWCPGCGDYGVVNALYKTMADLNLQREDLAVISGIGCSSRIPGYVNAYGFNGVHGRALTLATGVKLARPETTVIICGGDGDGLAIGMGHFPHAARRNLNMSYIMMDNRIYGLTKGQMSPTTEHDLSTKTSTKGNIEHPINPVLLALSVGVTFVARTVGTNIKHMSEIFKLAVEHNGFSFVHVLSPCITFRGKGQFDSLETRTHFLEPGEHDTSDFREAHEKTMFGEKLYMGVLYQQKKESFMQRYEGVRNDFMQGSRKTVVEVVDEFLP